MEILTCHKRRLRNVSIFVFLISLTFVIYQITFIATIDSSDKSSIVDLKPRVQIVTNETFRCRDGLVIDSYKFNDDYCDCDDGSDEPETNACTNSEFVCQHESNIARIPSGWVNDGVCDCCDGSDEYLSIVSPIKLTLSEQKKIGRFLTPCVNFCTS